MAEETEIKENVGCNLTVTVYLAPVWEELKTNNRFCVRSTIWIPVVQGTPKMQELVITDYFGVDKVEGLSDENPYVIQYGLYEGNYDKTRQPKGITRVWAYNLQEGTES